jgi:hypothetical protein
MLVKTKDLSFVGKAVAIKRQIAMYPHTPYALYNLYANCAQHSVRPITPRAKHSKRRYL